MRTLPLSHNSGEIENVTELVRYGELEAALVRANQHAAQFCGDKSSVVCWRLQLIRLQILAFLGQAEKCDALLDDDLVSEPPTLELGIALRILRGSACCRRGCYRDAKELLDRAALLAHESGYKALESEANIRRGFLFYQLDRLAESEAFYRQASDLGRLLEDPYLETVAMAGIGKSIMRTGSYAEATAFFTDLRRTADKLGDRVFSAMLACEVAWGYMNQRDYVPALNVLLEAEPVLRDTGVKQLYGICEADIGYIYLQWGSYQIATSYFLRALEIAVQAGDVVSQRKWTHNLALAYGKLGDEANTKHFAAAAPAKPVTWLDVVLRQFDSRSVLPTMLTSLKLPCHRSI